MTRSSSSSFLDLLTDLLHRSADLAVARIDLHRFQRIADTHGDTAAGKVRETLEARMAASIADANGAIRLNEGSYALAVAHAPSATSTLAAWAMELMEILSAPITVSDQPDIAVGCNVGVAAAWQFDEAEPLRLLTAAELAVQQADALGFRRAVVFRPPPDEDPTRFPRLYADMLGAVHNHEFVPYYQPVVSIPDGRVTGFEVLARWNHPRHGILTPADFLVEAETSGLIRQIDTDIRLQVIQDAAHLPRGSHLSFALNVSGADLDLESLADEVQAQVASAGIDNSRIVIEITETALGSDWASAQKVLQQLHDSGIRLAIDDFGTGNMYLDRVNSGLFDILKIDRSLVTTPPSALEDPSALDRRAQTLTAVASMARAFGMTTVAEGVETSADLARVVEAGCDLAQGYFFAHPEPLDRLPVSSLA